ncbi:MAG: helix-turn-helix domain-containing protein, partial [Lachnospiraceae bacterium]|nr:helix-turn-helix domain-containing protein [Lachnospiraceae bacterium]
MNKRIKEIRKALNLTQRAFGEKIGMQQNTIALIEGGRNTSRQTVDAICREFGVNKEWLLTGTGEMFAPDPQDELAALAEKYHYSPAAGLLIEKFISLPDDRREVIIKFLEDYAEALNRMKAE